MLYVKCIRNGGSSLMVYDGQTMETVNALISDLGGTNIVYLTEEEYRAEAAKF